MARPVKYTPSQRKLNSTTAMSAYYYKNKDTILLRLKERYAQNKGTISTFKQFCKIYDNIYTD